MAAYENLIDVLDLNEHHVGFLELIQAQQWVMALRTIPETIVMLPQIPQFYYTLDKVNEGYYMSKVDVLDFHFWSSYIAEVLGVPDDGDKTYFDNIRTDHFLEEMLEADEIVRTMITSRTRFNNPIKVSDLTWLGIIF